MRECDLVMKGGITSGVVYPQAIVEIAKEYRLRSIGGSSAGAIAAAVAAAAEYRRQTSPNPDKKSDEARIGYYEIKKIPDQLGGDIISLFQPEPKFKPMFDILLAAVDVKADNKPLAMTKAALKAYRGRALIAVAIGLAIAAVGVFRSDSALVILGILVGIILLTGSIGLALWRAVKTDLPEHGFGICSGLTQPGNDDKKPALTNWLADLIDEVAGNLGADGRPGDPLTVGQLAEHGVEIATMTTDLSSGRPYQLPLRNDNHYFSKSEFETLFPKRVVDYLVRSGEPLRDAGSTPPKEDLYRLVSGAAFPVLLTARLSLSFPGLISAVPLYREDASLPQERGRSRLRRCLFSDGGISSNFPIHFFDSFLPSRPTFGIALTAWDEVRHDKKRIAFLSASGEEAPLPVRDIVGVSGFLSSILNTAKDWQNTLQSLLPGYADRIVEVRLDDSREGGMNLQMTAKTIQDLSKYGGMAGLECVEHFKFDQHREWRALSLTPRLEEALKAMTAAYHAIPEGYGQPIPTYENLLTNYTLGSSKESSQKERDDRLAPFVASLVEIGGTLAPFVASLVEIGGKAAQTHAANGVNSTSKGWTPNSMSKLRLVASADQAPPQNG